MTARKPPAIVNVSRKLRIALWLLFAGSVYMIMSKTILFRPKSSTNRIILELFWEYRQCFSGVGYGKDIICNILLFVPFGFFLGLLTGRWYTVLAGFAVSLLIEVSQMVFQIGWFELDDIFNNTAGALIGFCAARPVRKRIAGT